MHLFLDEINDNQYLYANDFETIRCFLDFHEIKAWQKTLWFIA